jgi:hypothetical protein
MQSKLFLMPKGDRVFDFSLRILMLAVSAALVGCIAWLAWRWVNPPVGPSPVVPVTQVAPKVEPAPTKGTDTAPGGQQVLLAPGQVFRCESGGRVTFTDRPCPANSSSTITTTR